MSVVGYRLGLKEKKEKIKICKKENISVALTMLISLLATRPLSPSDEGMTCSLVGLAFLLGDDAPVDTTVVVSATVVPLRPLTPPLDSCPLLLWWPLLVSF